MEKKKLIALVAPLALVNLATIALAVATSTRTLSAFDHMEPNTNVIIDDGSTTPEEPDVPVTPDDPTTPDEPDTPEEPGDPETPEEPEEPEVPTIDPSVVYDFNTIKDLLMTYEELNDSFCIMRVKVAGTAFGTLGYCFFTDTTAETITYSSQITQEAMADMLMREDVGNNNANYNRGDIITISGTVTYGHHTKLGVDLVTIK